MSLLAGPLLLGPLLLAGCFASILEAPYVLATGAGEPAWQFSPGLDHTLVVASDQGVRVVDGSGVVTPRSTEPARVALDHLPWRLVFDPTGGRFSGGSTATVAIDQVRAGTAWCDHAALVARPGVLLLVRPDGGVDAWREVPDDVVDVGLAPGPACEAALVLRPDRVITTGPAGGQLVADGLEQARAASFDHLGRVWVVHQDPPVLALIQDGRPVTIARYLGDVVDLQFGTGELLHPDNAYLLNRDGQVDYVRVPTP
ncbi:MAG: hypothetical protein H6742_18865 [Alphaproteobacteria bacterium]|nr:hypothetical protein [Alphaproteobacteria bacterium]